VTAHGSGAAFPVFTLDPWRNPVISGGMTLRDYFAAKALQSLIAKYDKVECEEGGALPDYAKANVTGAYMYADAMLAEREAQP